MINTNCTNTNFKKNMYYQFPQNLEGDPPDDLLTKIWLKITVKVNRFIPLRMHIRMKLNSKSHHATYD